MHTYNFRKVLWVNVYVAKYLEYFPAVENNEIKQEGESFCDLHLEIFVIFFFFS